MSELLSHTWSWLAWYQQGLDVESECTIYIFSVTSCLPEHFERFRIVSWMVSTHAFLLYVKDKTVWVWSWNLGLPQPSILRKQFWFDRYGRNHLCLALDKTLNNCAQKMHRLFSLFCNDLPWKVTFPNTNTVICFENHFCICKLKWQPGWKLFRSKQHVFPPSPGHHLVAQIRSQNLLILYYNNLISWWLHPFWVLKTSPAYVRWRSLILRLQHDCSRVM